MYRQAVWSLKYVNEIYQQFANCKYGNRITIDPLNPMICKKFLQQTIQRNVSFFKNSHDQN